MQHLTSEQLGDVFGGAMKSASPVGGGYTPEPANLSSKLGMNNAVVTPPGGQAFENNHSGPNALQRVNKAFDDSTKVMRTFNDTFGVVGQKPGFGNGPAM
jgi:hypothetical protein